MNKRMLTMLLSFLVVICFVPTAVFAENVAEAEQNMKNETGETFTESEGDQPIVVETWQDHVARSFSGGKGTAENPYQINSAEELALLAKKVNAFDTKYNRAHYVLTSDIDLSEYEWMPIGNGNKNFDNASDNNFFFGTFDGNGFRIKNLHIQQDLGLWYYGLFGGSNGDIRNTILENAKISVSSTDKGWQAENGMGSSICAGSITGAQLNFDSKKMHKIENCIVINADVEVSAVMSLVCGAVIGNLNYAGISNTKASGSVTGISERGIWVGGFVGDVGNSTCVENCCFEGTVSSANHGNITDSENLEEGISYVHYVGGFVGSAGRANADITMKNCYAKAQLTGSSDHLVEAGGFAGIKEIVYQKACYQNLYCDSTISVEDENGKRQSQDFISNNLITLYTQEAEVVIEGCFYREGDKINVFKQGENDTLCITEDSSYEIRSLDLKKFMTSTLKLDENIWDISSKELPTLKMEKSHIASGHVFEEGYTIDKEANCIEGGRKSRHCKFCDAVTNITTTALTDHRWDKGVISQPPSYARSGIKLYTCSICKEQKTETVAPLKLKQPKLLSVLNDTKGITVKWKKVTGADGYYVYRRSGSGTWKKIAQMRKGTSYTDTKVKNGSSYTYTVAAYNGKNISAYNSRGMTEIRLTAPKISSLKNHGKKALTVKWMKNTKAGGYQIQYAPSSKFSKARTVEVSGKTVSKTIKKLSKNKKYYVRIRSYKKSGKTRYYSAWSNVKRIKIK